eukprot:TRINITY_DN47477_c0_g1_i1.p1 TRINITY_DN47477_c0_g1~~TRINITY_DN47477_c0_g1_i1.p1  ORF type:complete len:248 (+),score=67.88 TRINITY_DN47477_c0_g1_i1:89-832(+)
MAAASAMAAAIAAATSGGGAGGFLSFGDSVPTSRAAGASKRKRKIGKDAESSDSEEQKKQPPPKKEKKKKEEEERLMQDGPRESVEDLARAADSDMAACELVRRFVRAALSDWSTAAKGRKLAGLSEKNASMPSAKALQPLVDLVEMRLPGDPEASKVEKVCRDTLAGKYVKAEEAYLQLTIGNAKWPIGGGVFTSSDGPEAGNRMWGVKDRKVEATSSILDDAAQKTAIQNLKRLVTFVQTLRQGK